MRLTDDQRKERRQEAARFLSVRQNLGLNQGVAAAAIGISRSMLSLYESGRSDMADDYRNALYKFYRLVEAAASAGIDHEALQSKTEIEKSELLRMWEEKELVRFASEPGPLSDEKRKAQKFRRRSGSFTQKEVEARWRDLFPKDAISQTVISAYENGYATFTEAQVRTYDHVLDTLLAENPHAVSAEAMRTYFLRGNAMPEVETHIQKVGDVWVQGKNAADLARKVRIEELKLERFKIDDESYRLEWEIDRNERDPLDLNPDRSALRGLANMAKFLTFQQLDREYAAQQKKAEPITPDAPEEKE